MKRIIAPVLGLVIIGMLAAAVQFRDDLFEMRKNFEIFGALYEEIALNYVDDVRPQPFMRAGIESMLAELDPYTHYYDEADMVDMQLMQQRKLGTVGLNVGIRGGRLTVLAPENDAAAYRQGIRTGDLILQIGETTTDKLTVGEAYELLMGPPGTTTSVLVQRGSEGNLRTFVLPRSLLRTRNVSWSGYLGADSTDGIAYVRLDQFGNRSAREVKRAFRNMHRDVDLQGMVLDLRSNPGGIVGEAVNIVELFVPKGSVVVSTRARTEDAFQEFKTDEDPLFPDIPLVVLMDRYSASASEIVAGALQDYDRAVIMGETSFGKGLVQITRPLPHNTMLKMTVSHYYLPTGRTIQSFELNSASARVAIPTATDYSTEGGRQVRGGFGVEPDEEIRTPDPGEIESALLQESAFFLFADHWISDYCPEGAACSQVRDDMFDEFMRWLGPSRKQIVMDSDVLLDRLAEEATREGFGMQLELDAMKAGLAREKESQLQALRESIEGRIMAEVRSRLMTEPEHIQFEVDHDEVIIRANYLVRDRMAMERMLQ